MKATLGVVTAFARAWKGLLQGQPIPDDVFFGLSNTIRDITESGSLAELTEGAGGTAEDLAPLVISHINYFIPYPSSASVSLLGSAIVFGLQTTHG